MPKYHDVDEISWCWCNSMMLMKFYDEIPWYLSNFYEILWWNFMIFMKFYDEVPWYLWKTDVVKTLNNEML